MTVSEIGTEMGRRWEGGIMAGIRHASSKRSVGVLGIPRSF